MLLEVSENAVRNCLIHNLHIIDDLIAYAEEEVWIRWQKRRVSRPGQSMIVVNEATKRRLEELSGEKHSVTNDYNNFPIDLGAVRTSANLEIHVATREIVESMEKNDENSISDGAIVSDACGKISDTLNTDDISLETEPMPPVESITKSNDFASDQSFNDSDLMRPVVPQENKSTCTHDKLATGGHTGIGDHNDSVTMNTSEVEMTIAESEKNEGIALIAEAEIKEVNAVDGEPIFEKADCVAMTGPEVEKIKSVGREFTFEENDVATTKLGVNEVISADQGSSVRNDVAISSPTIELSVQNAKDDVAMTTSELNGSLAEPGCVEHTLEKDDIPVEIDQDDRIAVEKNAFEMIPAANDEQEKDGDSSHAVCIASCSVKGSVVCNDSDINNTQEDSEKVIDEGTELSKKTLSSVRKRCRTSEAIEAIVTTEGDATNRMEQEQQNSSKLSRFLRSAKVRIANMSTTGKSDVILKPLFSDSEEITAAQSNELSAELPDMFQKLSGEFSEKMNDQKLSSENEDDLEDEEEEIVPKLELFPCEFCDRAFTKKRLADKHVQHHKDGTILPMWVNKCPKKAGVNNPMQGKRQPAKGKQEKKVPKVVARKKKGRPFRNLFTRKKETKQKPVSTVTGMKRKRGRPPKEKLVKKCKVMIEDEKTPSNDNMNDTEDWTDADCTNLSIMSSDCPASHVQAKTDDFNETPCTDVTGIKNTDDERDIITGDVLANNDFVRANIDECRADNNDIRPSFIHLNTDVNADNKDVRNSTLCDDVSHKDTYDVGNTDVRTAALCDDIRHVNTDLVKNSVMDHNIRGSLSTHDNLVQLTNVDLSNVVQQAADTTVNEATTSYEASNEIQRHQCSLCDKQLSSFLEVIAHSLPGEDEKNTCAICRKNFSSISELKKHAKLYFKKKKPKKDAMTILEQASPTSGGSSSASRNCPLCMQRCLNVQMHIDQNHTCNVCQRVFVWNSQLRDHVIITHSHQYPHECQVCLKGFLRKGLKEKHEQGCWARQYKRQLMQAKK